MPNSSTTLLRRPETAGRSWRPSDHAPAFSAAALAEACADVRATHHVLRDERDGRLGLGRDGEWTDRPGAGMWQVLASLPPLYPEWLGDRSFDEVHGLRFPYVAGAMANGIAIEFHDCGTNWERLTRLLRLLSVDFVVAHLHGNNWRGLIPGTRTPEMLEITLLNRRMISDTIRRTTARYPRLGLDTPNRVDRPDFALDF